MLLLLTMLITLTPQPLHQFLFLLNYFNLKKYLNFVFSFLYTRILIPTLTQARPLTPAMTLTLIQAQATILTHNPNPNAILNLKPNLNKHNKHVMNVITFYEHNIKNLGSDPNHSPFVINIINL